MHVVTVSEPATTSSGLSQDLYDANPWLQLNLFLSLIRARSSITGLAGLLLASNEALLTVELPQAVRPDRYTYRSIIQANAEVAAPKSRGQRRATRQATYIDNLPM